jgi:site-specific recombinase XerD
MISFEKAVNVINEYYRSKNYSESYKNQFKKSIKQIKLSPDFNNDELLISNSWLNQKEKELSHQLFKYLRHAVYLLREVMKNGEVTTNMFVYSNSPAILQLNKSFKTSLDNFLIYFKKNSKVKDSYIIFIRRVCARMLLDLQHSGIQNPSQITYQSLFGFCLDKELNGHSGKIVSNQYNVTFKYYVEYIEKEFNKLPTLHWMLYLEKVKNLFFIEDLIDSEKQSFLQYRKESKDSYRFEIVKTSFIEKIVELGYASYDQKTQFLNAFQLFIDANKLYFSIELLHLWTIYICKTLNRMKRLGFERSEALFNQFYNTNDIDCTLLNNHQSKIYQIPQWSKKILDKYIEYRKAMEMTPSTLSMDCSSVSRFLSYLKKLGISSFSQLTPQVIINFQLQDSHKSAEGKNAYSIRIKAFIGFLGDEKMVPDTLALAFSISSAPSVKIVKVLDKKQKESIYDFVVKSSTPMEYRISAMAMLALHMGLRNIDIIRLKLTDVDIENQSLTIIQKKTGVSLILPIPNIVANCLYRYKKYGRPDKATNYTYFFVKHKMPYDELHSQCCAKQLNRIMKRYNCEPIRGLHTLRKDFASSELRSSVNFQTIAATLGHISTDSINPYLALDEKNMRTCPLSLKGLEIGDNENV